MRTLHPFIQFGLAILLAGGALSCATPSRGRRLSSEAPATSFRAPLWALREFWTWNRPAPTRDLTDWKAERIVETGEAILTRSHEVLTGDTPPPAPSAPEGGLTVTLSAEQDQLLSGQVSEFLLQVPERPDARFTPGCNHWIEAESIAGRKAVCFEIDSTPLTENGEMGAARTLLQRAGDAFHGQAR